MLKGLGGLAGALTSGTAATGTLAGRTASSAVAALPLGIVSVVGMRFQEAASRIVLAAGDVLLLRREPTHRRDPYAIAVHAASGERLGYLPREDARRLAPLIDAGGRVVADLIAGSAPAADGGRRIDAQLRLLAEATPAAHGPAAAEQVIHLLQAAPLLAERINVRARAVMLSGPCAGWQRTGAAEWVPPGALPWPAWDGVGHQYQLIGGSAAAIETARAMREAERLGLPRPGTEDDPPPPRHLATPVERPKLLLRGRLLLEGRLPGDPALVHLSLRRPAGALACMIHDRDGAALAALPAAAGQLAARLEEEGFILSIWPAKAAPHVRPDGRLALIYEIHLRGNDPPHIAQQRAELLLHIARILPGNWDAEQHFGRLPHGVLWRFIQQASPVAHRQDGRLDEAQAAQMLRAAGRGPDEPSCDADEHPVGPTRRLVRRHGLPTEPLAPKRRGRGMALPQRLRLVAARLEAGLRETPQRFRPVAAHLMQQGVHERRHFLASLVQAIHDEARTDIRWAADRFALLVDANAAWRDGGGRMYHALHERLEALAPNGRRLPAGGDRHLQFLFNLVDCGRGGQDGGRRALIWAIAYAMADYIDGPFILEGAVPARRVRWLADVIEAGLADRAGLRVDLLDPP